MRADASWNRLKLLSGNIKCLRLGVLSQHCEAHELFTQAFLYI